MRLPLTIIALLLAPCAAFAQTACPTVAQGQQWTVQQWNACFASLAAASNGTLISPAISGGVITGGSINGAAITPSGGIGTIVTVNATQTTLTAGVSLAQTIVMNLATPAASSVILPAASNWPLCPSQSLTACPTYTVKDGAGNAAAYNITVTAADGKNIDGAASAVIASNYGDLKFVLNGAQWNVVP